MHNHASPSESTLAAFPVFEARLSELLGAVSRTTLRQLRKENLTVGVDWVHGDGERVCLSLAAVEKLRAAILSASIEKKTAGGPSAEAGGASEQEAKPEDETEKLLAAMAHPSEIVELEAVRVNLLNRQLILCCLPGTPAAERQNVADLLRVRVRDAENFVVRDNHGRPFMVPARCIQGTLYELVGRCPRQKGKW